MDPRAPGHEELLSVELPDGARIVIQPFPRERSFARDIARVLKALRGDAASEARLRMDVQDTLRSWYPRIEIQPRNALAGLIAEEHVWYALRDGRVRQASDQTNRLHAALSNARQTSVESDVAVEHARAAMDFASKPRARERREPVASSVRAGVSVIDAAPRDEDEDIDG